MAMVSECCGARNKSNGDSDYMEYGICPECKEYCEFVDDCYDHLDDNIDNGPTGHGDICMSDADPGL